MGETSSSVFVFFLFSLLITDIVVCQGRLNGSDECRKNNFPTYICTKWNECAKGKEIIQNRKAIFCGLETTVPKLCCPPEFVKLFSTKGTTDQDVISNTPKTAKDPVAVAEKKCIEYGKYRYRNTTIPGQLIGDESTVHSTLDCVIVQELIVGGQAAEPKEFPHMALIGYGNSFNSVRWACGGTLISERFVMSAAHCGSTVYGDAKWILLGDLNIASKDDIAQPKVFQVKRRFDHPDYKPNIAYNDITLFQLNSTVELNAFIRPICLHTSKFIPKNETKVSATGWGLTGTIERRSDHLLKVSISFIDEEKCRSKYGNEEKLPHGYDSSSMVCAGDSFQEKGTCLGDSGGPIQLLINDKPCMWTQVGITSIGSTFCGDIDVPSVYTRVANYIDWIQRIVWP